jgi:hypothetical protein
MMTGPRTNRAGVAMAPLQDILPAPVGGAQPDQNAQKDHKSRRQTCGDGVGRRLCVHHLFALELVMSLLEGEPLTLIYR